MSDAAPSPDKFLDLLLKGRQFAFVCADVLQKCEPCIGFMSGSSFVSCTKARPCTLATRTVWNKRRIQGYTEKKILLRDVLSRGEVSIMLDLLVNASCHAVFHPCGTVLPHPPLLTFVSPKRGARGFP